MGIRHKAEGLRQDRLSRWIFQSVAIAVALATLSPLSTAAAQDGRSEVDNGKSAHPPRIEYQQTTEDLNRRLAEINHKILDGHLNVTGDYRIGPDDQLDVAVLEASELSRTVRVSASGDISLALVGSVHAAGLTPRELEIVIEELYRRSYILDPHVSVEVRDMQSHTVAVFGAVKKPGVFQIREAKTLVELLSLAEGLDQDAGDTVIVEHRGASARVPAAETGDATGTPSGKDTGGEKPAAAIPPADPSGHSAPELPAGVQEGLRSASTEIKPADDSQPIVEQVDLKKLLDTGDAKLNVLIYPGDVVKVPRAELVYVVGEVTRPGGFELKSNENISVLQAVALAQGLTHTSAGSRARIIRSDSETGQRREIAINLNRILAGKTPDPILEPRDIVFVPNSVGRTVAYRSLDVIASASAGIAVYRW